MAADDKLTERIGPINRASKRGRNPRLGWHLSMGEIV